jgi:hypothetical protein
VSRKGITVGGVPLDEHLKRQQDEEELAEIEEATLEYVNGEITFHRKNMPPYTRRDQMPDRTFTSRGRSRVSKPPRTLTRKEIEEEYGMTQPADTPKPQILFRLWKNKGSLTADEVAEALDYTRSTAGTLLWRASAIWPHHIDVDKTETPNVYTMSHWLRRQPEKILYEKYKEHMRGQYHKHKKLKGKPEGEPKVEEPPKVEEKETTITDELKTFVHQVVRDIVNDVVANSLTDSFLPVLESTEPEAREINLNVNVTFSFKLGG